MPTSLDAREGGARTLKSKLRHCSRGLDDNPDTDVAVRALSQLIGADLSRLDVDTSLSCSQSPEPAPARSSARLSSARLLASTSLNLPPPRRLLLRPSLTAAASLPSSPSEAAAAAPKARAERHQAAAQARDDGGAPLALQAVAVAARGGSAARHRATMNALADASAAPPMPAQATYQARAFPSQSQPGAVEELTLRRTAAQMSAAAGGPGAAAAGRDVAYAGGLVRVAAGRDAAGGGAGRNLSLRALLARQSASAAAAAAAAAAAVGAASGSTAAPGGGASGLDRGGVPEPAPAAAAAPGGGGAIGSVFSTNFALAGDIGRAGGGNGAALSALPPSPLAAAAPRIAARASAPNAVGREYGMGAEAEAEAAGDDTSRPGPGLLDAGGALGLLEAPPALPSYGSAPLVAVYGGQVKLPYQASRHMSQVAFLQMLQQGAAAPGGGQLAAPGPSAAQQYQQHMATLNLGALSREITGLRWIGQGGGGAVFQGVWQGAPVAVKFLLSEANPECPGEIDAVALEGVVSSVVNHPNVVHTFAFQCTRLTDASFAADGEYGRNDSVLDDQGNPDLLESLLDTSTMYGTGNGLYGTGGGSGSGVARRAVSPLGAAAAASAGAGGFAGPSRLSAPAVQLPAVPGSDDSPSTLPRYNEGDDGGAAEPDVRRRVRDARDGGRAAPAAAEPDVQRRALKTGEKARGQAAAAAAASRQAALESTFQSDEGFGDPDISGGTRGWTVLQALTHLKARSGMYMTYIIMEYCDRGSLLAAIRRGIFRMDEETSRTSPTSAAAAAPAPSAAAAAAASRFPRRIVLRALLRTARDVAQGMSHLHANGIIHGDLKPGNVLLRGCRTDRRGFVAMVADFGLSKVSLGDKPLEAHHWSTVTVMAPEVIMGRWLKASDVFSFGILLWQLVTSEPVPYGKLTVPQILLGVAQGSLKPEWPASAHPALVRLGKACLATSPEKRPSFEAIVKVLTKIEKHIRNELRLQRAAAASFLPSPVPSAAAGYDD